MDINGMYCNPSPNERLVTGLWHVIKLLCWHELDYLYQKIVGCKATNHGEYVEAATITLSFNQEDGMNIPGVVVESQNIGIAGSKTRISAASCRQSGLELDELFSNKQGGTTSSWLVAWSGRYSAITWGGAFSTCILGTRITSKQGIVVGVPPVYAHRT